MKKYYNISTKEWYTEGDTITRRIDNGVFSGIPSLLLLAVWGFEELVEQELTEEYLLQKAKLSKIIDLTAYDMSYGVNSFTLGNQLMWLTVEERQQIATQINASEAAGRDSMTRWFNGHEYTFPLTVWKQMLVALEIYAGDALNVTERHKATINALTTIEDVAAYDFTTGYPEKLNFDINS